jgi:hypothetical protein
MSSIPDKTAKYDEVLNALIEKTKAGKLRWDETADEDTFLAAVKGKQTFVISKKKIWTDTGDLRRFPILSVRDGEGRTLFETPKETCEKAGELLRLAGAVAKQEDQRIDETLQLLNQL